MKKDKQWLRDRYEKMETIKVTTKNSRGKHSTSYLKKKTVINLLNQLDEPEVKQLDRKIKELESYNDELVKDNNQLRNAMDSQEVLSQKWIDKNVVHVRGLGDIIEAEAVENLLVPKQEELEAKIQELIEAYKQEEDAYSNPENGWIGGFIEDLKNLVEEEQKYYVLGKHDTPILFRDHRNRITETSNLSDIYPKADSEDFELTEQEIKDYDERCWSFAVKVEELEE